MVPIAPKDRPKTAFSTPWNQFQFKYLPFGLCNGPATYARLVNLVMQGVPLEQAIPYLDDTIAHSATVQGHFEALEGIFMAYQKAGLKFQPGKCQFFKSEVKYLGHTVSGKGIQPSPDHLDTIKDWPLAKDQIPNPSLPGEGRILPKVYKGLCPSSQTSHGPTIPGE